MKTIIVSILFSIALVGCSHEDSSPPPGSEASLDMSQSMDIRELIWNQLSESNKKQVIGTWKDAEVKKVTLKQHSFHNDEDYIGQELIQVTFKAANESLLGPIRAFADPQTRKILGIGLRD